MNEIGLNNSNPWGAASRDSLIDISVPRYVPVLPNQSGHQQELEICFGEETGCGCQCNHFLRSAYPS
jgi:hypothetical protein